MRVFGESGLEQSLESFADRFDSDTVEDVACKCRNEHPLGGVMTDSARSQIEERLLIELANRCTMGAFNVVRIDLELGLGVDACLLGKDKIAIGLFGIGFLGVLSHEDLAIEHAFGVAIEDPIVVLVAVAKGFGMIDEGMMIDMLAAMHKIESVHGTLGVFGAENRLNVVARQAGPRGDRVREEIRVAALLDLNHRHVKGVGIFVLKLAVFQDGTVLKKDFCDDVGEGGARACADVTFNNFRLGLFAQDDKVSRLNGRVLARTGRKEEKMNRVI